MTRAVEEWIGKHDDEPVPPRVRLRLFDAHKGVCYLSKRKIRPGEMWQLDHMTALCNGGQHRESNLAPVLTEPHKRKTAQDVAEKARIDRKRKKHLGIRKATKLQSRGFAKAPAQRSATRPLERRT